MLAYPIYAILYVVWAIGQLFRRMRRPPDYVTFLLQGSYLELKPPPRGFIMRRVRPAEPSMQDLVGQFRAVARDPRVRGVVLHIRPLAMPLGQLDSLRGIIGELRAAGKKVIAWAPFYDAAMYYVACAADRILLLPGGELTSLGLARRYEYLADALGRVGLKADFVQISPYKSAGDMLTRNSMSDEVREMTNWLMDSAYAEIQRAIAEGRHVDEAAARDLIDSTPCVDQKAKELGTVDDIIAEDDLPAYLQDGPKPARMDTWGSARRALLRRPPRLARRYVAVLGIEGGIVDGYSQRPPSIPLPVPVPFVTEPRAGDLSVVQVARRILADRRAAAVVLFVDSGGGSATASEAMRSAIAKIAAKKPLVVSMGSVAASGGYWVSTPGKVLMAQPNTITGSIGVLTGKFINTGLLDLLSIGHETISRGKMALLYGPEHAFTDEERKTVRETIEHLYGMFLDRVSASRNMEREAVDAIGGGRVWTGRQALENGLVDEMGGLQQAFAKARELGGLGERAPVRLFWPGGGTIPPAPEPKSALAYALEGVRILNRGAAMLLCPVVWE